MGIKEKIERLADQAVVRYIRDGACMDKTIAAAAKAENLNNKHIDRIVQAANKKVFLKLFPEKHEFDVASKEGVEKIMNKDVAASKSAGCNLDGSPQYGEAVNYKLLELARPATTAAIEKTASSRSLMILRGQIKRATEELEYEMRRKRAMVLNAENDLIAMSKQAMLRGVTFADLETYALSLCKNEKVAGVIDGIFDKVKDIRFIEKKALCRGKAISPFVGKSNSYTDAIDKMIKAAYEDLPVIEDGLTLLNTKLKEINNILGTKNGS